MGLSTPSIWFVSLIFLGSQKKIPLDPSLLSTAVQCDVKQGNFHLNSGHVCRIYDTTVGFKKWQGFSGATQVQYFGIKLCMGNKTGCHFSHQPNRVCQCIFTLNQMGLLVIQPSEGLQYVIPK